MSTPGELQTTIHLPLSPEERKILLDTLIFTDVGLERRLHLTVADAQEIALTPDEVEELADSVAASANHIKNRKAGKALDRIFERIEQLLAAEAQRNEGEKEPIVIDLSDFSSQPFRLEDRAWEELGRLADLIEKAGLDVSAVLERA